MFPAGFTFFDLDNEVDITATNISITCSEAHSAPCKAETAHCYFRADTCIFDSELVDEQRAFEVQSTCRDRAHLRRSCGVFGIIPLSHIKYPEKFMNLSNVEVKLKNY